MNNKGDKVKKARTIITGVLCAFILFTLVPRVKMVYELSQRKANLKEQKVHLLKINKSLARQDKELDSPAAIERIAREQLGMIKKGEKVVVEVVPGGNKSN